MLKFGNKEFRNLQEQVKKNMDDILFILQEEGVLNEFGIKVVGQEESVLDMPTVAQYKEDNPDWSYGDAYAIGEEDPYELYILTRANGTHPNDYWFNIGEFPVPGPEGPEGPQGETGPQGQTGPAGQDGISPQLGVGNVVVETLESDQDATVAITESGTLANPIWNFNFGIPRGEAGSATTTLPWGAITGSIANQTDLVSALQNKANVSALSSYATQVYADNVANNAEYQAIQAITNSAVSFASAVSFEDAVVFNSYIYKGQSNYINYPIELPSGSGTLALVEDIPSLTGYATEAWVSSNFLSSSTFIPSVYGSNDGTNWTDLTINGSTYGFAAGGGNAEWGSISGTLSDQTDLMSKFSEYALLTDIPSLSGYATETYVTNQLSSYALSSSLSLYALSSVVDNLNYASVGALSANTVIPSDTNDLTNGAGYITNAALNGYATESWVSSNFLSSGYVPSISGAAMLSGSNVFTSYNKFQSNTYFAGSIHVDIGAGDVMTIEGQGYVQQNSPITFGNSTVAPMFKYGQIRAYGDGNVGTYYYSLPQVSGTIALTSDLSIYAPLATLSSYATQAWVSSQSYLTEETLPTLTLNTESYVSPSYILQGLQIGSTTYNLYSPDLSLYATQSYVTSLLGSYATQSYVTSNFTTLYQYSALSSRVDSLDYASVGALSSATVIPDITGLASEGYVNSSISALSSIYAPISLVSDVSNLDYLSVGALSSATVIPDITGLASEQWVSANFLSSGWTPDLSGYATESYVTSAISALNYASVGALSANTTLYGTGTETWTFTLSDNTTVSKTIVLG